MNKIVKSHKCCILCLKSPIKVPDLKLHRFPTNEKKRNVWLNACGLVAEEYSPNRRLCSRHFDETCYTKNGSRLKLDAIPTIYLKGQIIRPFFRLSEKNTINDIINSTPETNKLTIQPSTSETDISSEMNEGSQLIIQPSTSEIGNNSYKINSMNESTQTVLSRPSTSELQETPKKKKRFTSEIKTPVFASSNRARKSFKITNTQIQIQKNKIKLLNHKVRRLNKKLSSLKLLLNNLKQKIF